MPMSNGKYVAPTWVNGGPPALDAAELQAMCDSIVTLATEMNGKVKCAYGSYVGTGTYGSANPNSLTFSFQPKIIFITSPNGSSNSGQYFSNLMAIDADFYPYMDGFVYDAYFKTSAKQMTQVGYMKIDGNTITWYETTNAYDQANSRGFTYSYFAIG